MRRLSPLTILVTICFIAFILRVFRLDVQSLWYDEAFSAYLAHFDLAEITARTAADIQPPLYYALLHFWIALAGDSEFALRFLSLVFGVLTIPLMFVIARRLFTPTPDLPRSQNRRTGEGVFAAILAALAPLYVWYSQEARMYTLIAFLLLLSSYCLLRALTLHGNAREIGGNEGNRWWIGFAIANIAAIYTHYFAFVVIAFQLLFTVYCSLFTSLRSRFTFYVLRFIFYFALIFAAFLPWLPLVLARFGQDASYWQGALKLDEAIRHIFINFATGESVLEAQAQWIAVGWLSCLVVGWFVKLKVKSQKSKVDSLAFVILYLAVPLTLLLILFSRNPKFNARYLMIASPAFFLLLADGLASISRIILRLGSGQAPHVLRFTFCLLPFAFLLFTSVYADANAYFDPAFTKASFREVARYVEQYSAPGEAIILTSGHLFPAFDYYYHGEAPQIRLPDDPTLNTDHVLGYDTSNILNQTIAGKPGVWVVLWQDEVVDPNGFIPLFLSSRGKEEKIEGANFYQVRLRHWTLQPGAQFSTQPEPAIRREANFKNVINLLGADARPTPADVGASFSLYWQALDKLDDDYLVALRVVDAAGNLWGKLDRRPVGYNYPTPRWKNDEKLFGAYTVPLLPGAPAGDYFVEVAVYAVNDPRGLDVLAPNGAPMGKSVKLGPIPVLPSAQPASIASLNIAHTVNQPLWIFTLLGYELGRDHASAGESIPLTLFWRADSQPNRDYVFSMRFGRTTSNAFPLANLNYPTSQWHSGEIIRGQYNIVIPADASEGIVSWGVQLNSDKGVEGGYLFPTPFTIEKTDRVFVKPAMQFEQNVNFANVIALAGYQFPTTIRSGDSLKIVLYWQARGTLRVNKPYTVFVHLLDQNNKVVAQKDAQPLNGARPTNGWVANEFIADTYELPIKPDTPPGKYQIEIGWYDATDFSRLQVIDDNGMAVGDNAILNTNIQVK